MNSILIGFAIGVWLGYGLELLTAKAILKISSAYHRLFKDWVSEKKKNKILRDKLKKKENEND